MASGPNDFHYASEGGRLVIRPGLGADEPKPETRAQMEADAEAHRVRQEALARAESAIQAEAETLDAKRLELEAREADLNKRLADLDAMTAPEKAPSRTARQATERHTA